MKLFDKFFKKRQLPDSSDEPKVFLTTNKDLSEEQKNTIIAIVKDGITSGTYFGDIAIKIMMSTGIYDVIVINRTKNGIEVMF